jgi:hypothetical protein
VHALFLFSDPIANSILSTVIGLSISLKLHISLSKSLLAQNSSASSYETEDISACNVEKFLHKSSVTMVYSFYCFFCAIFLHKYIVLLSFLFSFFLSFSMFGIQIYCSYTVFGNVFFIPGIVQRPTSFHA